MSFDFLRAEWPQVHEAARRAAAAAYPDPRASCFYAPRALVLAVSWMFKHDAALKLPYQDSLSALIPEPTFKAAAGEAVFGKVRVINTLGNRAVHSERPIPQADAVAAVRELFHFGYWLAHTYSRAAEPAPGLAFDPNSLPKTSPLPKQAVEKLRQQESELRARDEKLALLLADKSALGARGISWRQEPGREPDRVHESDRRSPYGARRNGCRAALRVAIHRSPTTWAGWHLRLGASRRAGQGAEARAGLGAGSGIASWYSRPATGATSRDPTP